MNKRRDIPEERIKELEEALSGRTLSCSSCNEMAKELEECSKVYWYITNGKLSKTNYLAEVVKAEADECYDKLYRKEIEDLEKDLATLREAAGKLKEALKRSAQQGYPDHVDCPKDVDECWVFNATETIKAFDKAMEGKDENR